MCCIPTLYIVNPSQSFARAKVETPIVGLQKTRILGLEDRSTLLIRSFGQCGDCFPIGGSKLPTDPMAHGFRRLGRVRSAAAAARRVV